MKSIIQISASPFSFLRCILRRRCIQRKHKRFIQLRGGGRGALVLLLFCSALAFFFNAFFSGLRLPLLKSCSCCRNSNPLPSGPRNYLLLCIKLHFFSKTLENCNQRYLKHQQYIKELISISRQTNTA